MSKGRPPLWSSGQSSLLQVQRFRVRFLELPDFLRSSGSGGADEDVTSSIKKANVAFVQLYRIWKNKNIRMKTKLKILTVM
jgi:hypothetical protein